MFTAEEVREAFDYDPSTGLLVWRHYNKKMPKKFIGAVAGTITADGYVQIRFKKKLALAHRLAWLWMTGEMPSLVDHIDGNRANNAWANLRLASPSQNLQNAKLFKNNSIGAKGVYFDKVNDKFIAQISVNRQRLFIGRFETIEQAHEAYRAAAQKHFGEFARLS